MKKNIYKFGFIVSLLIIVALGIITYIFKSEIYNLEENYVISTVNYIEPDTATQYYVFGDSINDLQTLQFQVCKTLSYTVLGRFYGKKNGSNFQLDSIYFQPLIMSHSNKYDGKKLKLKNIKDFFISKDEIMFTYSIELEESSEIFDTTYTIKHTKNIIDGMFIEFKPLKVPDFCKDSQVSGATGFGGYECNGRGKVN